MAFTGAYDAVPNIVAAYSTRRLLTSYSGNLLRLRRDSDNAVSDFGADGDGNLDTAAIATWLGANSGYVVTWYDQSGGAVNATQATAAAQPLYAAAGMNGHPALTFDGTSDFMSRTGLLSVAADYSLFLVINSGAADGIILMDTAATADRCFVRFSSGNIITGNYDGTNKAASESYTDTANDHIVSKVYTVAGGPNGWLDGTAFAGSTYDGVSGGGGIMWFGANKGLTLFYNGLLSEVIVCSAALSGTDRGAAETAANNYWLVAGGDTNVSVTATTNWVQGVKIVG